MIQIILYKRDGLNIGFRTSGHAEFDERGYDVVCAAISVLAINTENSIELLSDDRYEIDFSEEDALIDLRLTDSPSQTSSVLLQSFEIGVNAISEEYGKDYIQLRIEEV
jgi:uncharacterized protein YsxB (DUF464 family)